MTLTEAHNLLDESIPKGSWISVGVECISFKASIRRRVEYAVAVSVEVSGKKALMIQECGKNLATLVETVLVRVRAALNQDSAPPVEIIDEQISELSEVNVAGH